MQGLSLRTMPLQTSLVHLPLLPDPGDATEATRNSSTCQSSCSSADGESDLFRSVEISRVLSRQAFRRVLHQKSIAPRVFRKNADELVLSSDGEGLLSDPFLLSRGLCWGRNNKLFL